MQCKFELSNILAVLESVPFIGNVDLLLSDEVEKRCFYKLPCMLIPSRHKLDIKFIRSEKELI
ncbi:MAG TPA: hypothetical protein DCP92_00360 [Nitrospiraceae bacterium]|jgi:hypothetical protein|nr:hypothetical protein [Nitrospiraceae bacterium]